MTASTELAFSAQVIASTAQAPGYTIFVAVSVENVTGARNAATSACGAEKGPYGWMVVTSVGLFE